MEQPLNQNSEKRKTIEKIERRQFGVADRAGKHSLIGIITMGDIIHAQTHAALEAETVLAADAVTLHQA